MDGQEVCLLLNISKRTLQSYRDNGTIGYSYIGRKCFYRADEIENMLGKNQGKDNVHV
ncbi:helix-turn-helix domain-containing protein [Rikenella microfusus]|uniref:helix-turn-helix domain-containing protein n=1 Tax=Rikenella microfusus TaxID=28139 RepID=UPI00040EFA41|nr:helix-turn-helix domain-containing protein [Rikenella microfusus]